MKTIVFKKWIPMISAPVASALLIALFVGCSKDDGGNEPVVINSEGSIQEVRSFL